MYVASSDFIPLFSAYLLCLVQDNCEYQDYGMRPDEFKYFLSYDSLRLLCHTCMMCGSRVFCSRPISEALTPSAFLNQAGPRNGEAEATKRDLVAAHWRNGQDATRRWVA